MLFVSAHEKVYFYIIIIINLYTAFYLSPDSACNYPSNKTAPGALWVHAKYPHAASVFSILCVL